MTAMQLVRPVAGHDEHALVAQAAREEREEAARRTVGPVDVLDREQQRALLAEALDERQQRLEQTSLRVVVVAAGVARLPEGRKEAGERRAGRGREGMQGRIIVPGEWTERPDDRGVGQLALAQLDAVAADRTAAELAHAALELGDEPGLADA
jgi:hypothetical protein